MALIDRYRHQGPLQIQWVTPGSLRNLRGLQIPDFVSTFPDCAVTREPAGARYVEYRLSRPGCRIGIARIQFAVGAGIVGQVGKVAVVIAIIQQSAPDRPEDASIALAEMVTEDEIQSLAGLRLIGIVPVRIVPAAAVCHLLRRQAKQEEVLLPRLMSHFDGRAIARADG